MQGPAPEAHPTAERAAGRLPRPLLAQNRGTGDAAPRAGARQGPPPAREARAAAGAVAGLPRPCRRPAVQPRGRDRPGPPTLLAPRRAGFPPENPPPGLRRPRPARPGPALPAQRSEPARRCPPRHAPGSRFTRSHTGASPPLCKPRHPHPHRLLSPAEPLPPCSTASWPGRSAGGPGAAHRSHARLTAAAGPQQVCLHGVRSVHAGGSPSSRPRSRPACAQAPPRRSGLSGLPGSGCGCGAPRPLERQGRRLRAGSAGAGAPLGRGRPAAPLSPALGRAPCRRGRGLLSPGGLRAERWPILPRRARSGRADPGPQSSRPGGGARRGGGRGPAARCPRPRRPAEAGAAHPGWGEGGPAAAAVLRTRG